jgi:alkylation response protein AidB-like acyl-CoA dehydrogenase
MTAPEQAEAEEERLILESIDRFLEREVTPHARRLEHEDTYPEDIVEGMKGLGLFGATIAQEYGGLGLSASIYARIVERMSRVWMSVTGIFNSHLIMAAAVERFGTDAQKEEFLPRFASGELRGGLALTEPDCGTDLQAVRTTAVREGDHYVINGTKTWISNGVYGQIFALLVKTDPAAEPRHRGMSLFLAEKGEGFRVSRKLEKLGYKGIELRYSQVRKTFGKPICQHQAIQIKLADMATRVEAAQLLVESSARAYDRGQRCDMEAGMAKLFASEAAIENSLEAMRIHGGYGYSPEFDVERYYRDAPLLAIGEGTNELQRIIIARQLVERNPV